MSFNQALRAEWKNAGYPGNVGSAAVSLPPPRGFRRAYHLTAADHAISNIVFGRLKVAKFSELNDPFELLAPTGAERNIRRLLKQHKERVTEETGLLCFSGDWTNPLLWSHYGARHRGIALGLDIATDLLIDVQYEEERVPIPKGTTTVGTELFGDLVRIKFESWRYEQECRILVPLEQARKQGETYFYPMSSKVRLVEIILGELCSLDVNEVRKLNHAANTFRARRANKYFKIVPDGRTAIPATPAARP